MSDFFADTDLIGPPTDAPAVNFGADDLLDTQALTTVEDAVIVGVPMMDATEARAVVTRIKTRIDVARGELLELKDREGWKALGYSSWGACAKAEFGGSAATLYRQLEAAEIARNLGDSQFENLPTSQLQAVKDLPPDQARQALDQAREKTNGHPTARDVWAAADQVAQRTPPDLVAAGVQLTRHGSWFQATGFSGVMNGWTSGKAEPWDLAVHAAREEIERRTTPAADPPATPDLADILLRLGAHGYDRVGTPRQKGMTTLYTFRDRASDLDDDSSGVIEMAEGELALWLAELDDNARWALARQEQFLDMQQRFAVFDWRLRRENKEFGLYKPNGGCVGVWKNLDQHMRQLKELERSRANRIARGDPAYAAEIAADAQPDPAIPHLPPDFTDIQKRAAKIGLFIAMDMHGMFSIKNAGGSGVDHIAEWDSLLRHLAYSEQAAAEIAAERGARHSSVFTQPGIALSMDLQKQLVSAGASIGGDGTVYAPRGSGEPSAILTTEQAEAALTRWAAITEAPAPTEAQRISDGAKRRAIGLLRELEPLMKLIKTEDFEGMSQAITDLNECEEGTEAEHWVYVGYALCDVEKD